jgi:hypothetical protein
MKTPLILTALIILAAAWIGQKTHTHLHNARQENQRILAQARSLGLDPASLLEERPTSPRQRAARPLTAEKQAKAKDFAARLASFALEMEQRQKDGIEPDESHQDQIFQIMDEMLQLDPEQLKILIDELRQNPQLSSEMRSNIVGFAVMMLANDHPAKALALFTESSDLFAEGGMSEHAISSALARLAQTDPDAALAWVREHSKSHPKMVTDDTKNGLIRGTAKRDPLLAFQLIAELNIENPSSAAAQIASSGEDPAARTAILTALRKHLESLPEGEERDSILSSTLSGIASRTANDGFDAATKWFDSANLDPKETEIALTHINYHQTHQDTGRWLEWMSEKLPPAQHEIQVNHMINQWASNDYQAAGQWLLETPAGPSKTTAIKSYAETVAPHHPESARQWANSLPPGQDRDDLLQRIENLISSEPPTEIEILPKSE